MRVLVTGGAGFIGSIITKKLKSSGLDVIVIDNLISGSSPNLFASEFVEGDIRDPQTLEELFNRFSFDVIFHLAGSLSVSESIIKPELYYENNSFGTLNLLNAARHYGVDKFIYSSTSAVYGESKEKVVTENTPTSPIHPYGRSKLFAEKMIQDFGYSYGLKYLILRYANVAGADPELECGPYVKPALALIPAVVEAMIGLRDSIKVYGDDYDTIDGTGIRDYIHVADLANAHIKGYQYLSSGGSSAILNLGSHKPSSVMQVINTAKEISGKDFKVVILPRRSGDVPEMTLNCNLAQKNLNWRNEYSLHDIIKHTYDWYLKEN